MKKSTIIGVEPLKVTNWEELAEAVAFNAETFASVQNDIIKDQKKFRRRVKRFVLCTVLWQAWTTIRLSNMQLKIDELKEENKKE